jgi:hypothetical protein
VRGTSSKPGRVVHDAFIESRQAFGRVVLVP